MHKAPAAPETQGKYLAPKHFQKPAAEEVVIRRGDEQGKQGRLPGAGGAAANRDTATRIGKSDLGRLGSP